MAVSYGYYQSAVIPDFNPIHILMNDIACEEGYTTMPVVVMIQGEEFKFYPQCRLKFSSTFKLRSGMKCSITSSMCTNFNHEIEDMHVTCGTYTHSAEFECNYIYFPEY